jgi:predicted membrane-bound spermidine synthase
VQEGPRPTEPKPAPRHGAGTRRAFLIAAAFSAGAAVMIIELAGNRVLAPWFGNSLYTWTGLIGVILVSLSGGAYLGGYLADRRPDYIVLSHLLTAAALLTVLIPLLQSALSASVGSLGVVWGPVLGTVLLFAVPGCLLASVSPFSIRLISLLNDDKRVGLSAGTIGMVATLGSVLGTFGSGFVLIPHLGLRTVFLTTGLVLAALGAVGYGLFWSRLRGRKLAVGGPLLVLAVALAAAAFSKTKSRQITVMGAPAPVIFEKTTFYHKIRVAELPTADGDTARFLYLDTTQEGSQYVGSDEMVARYQDYWQLAKLFCPEIRRAAFLGGGAFTWPEALLDAFPEARADVVEIDPEVIEVGRKYFRVDEYPRMHVVADDARRFLRASDVRYDLVFGDAYHGVHCIPAHLVTREFFELVRDRLGDRGIYIINVHGALEGEGAIVFRSLARTLATVFQDQCVFSTAPDDRDAVQNIFLVAAAHDLPVDAIRHGDHAHRRLADDLFRGYLAPDEYDLADGVVFTDNYNPVEYLVARTLRTNGRRP